MLKDLTSEKLIRLNVEADTWEDVVRKCAMPLEEEGMIKDSYIDAIIQSVKEAGPYIVITPHIALPHARPESGAIRSAIGIATLKHPVEFGNAANDPVKYVFTLSAKDNDGHLSALADLAELLENTAFFKMLDGAKNPKEVIDFLNK